MSDSTSARVLYYCPTAGEIEQQPGGGFHVCCHAPELHEPVLAVVYAAIRKQVTEEIAQALEARFVYPTAARLARKVGGSRD